MKNIYRITSKELSFLLFSILMLFLMASFEAFWLLVFGHFSGSISVGISITFLFIFLLIFSYRLSVSIPALVFISLLYISVIYFLIISLLFGVEDSTRWLLVFIAFLAISFLSLSLFFVKFHGGTSTFYQLKVLLIITVFFVVCYFLNYYLVGRKHGVFNQNWVMIGLVFFVLFSTIFFGGLSRKFQLLLWMYLSILSYIFDSMGVLLTSFSAFLVCALRVYRLAFFVSFVFPLFFVYLSKGFDFLLINEMISSFLGLDDVEDYSSNRFSSWNVIKDSWSSDSISLWFGSGLDQATSIVFSGEVNSTAHNFWFETAYRSGLVGVALILFPYIVLYFFVQDSYKNFYALSFFVLLMLSNFYDIGGFTHHIGTAFFKSFLILIFSCSMADSRSDLLASKY